MGFFGRPTKACRGCGYTWKPRGHDLSRQCPRCKGMGVFGPPGMSAKSCLVVFSVLFVVSAVFVALVVNSIANVPSPSGPPAHHRR